MRVCDRQTEVICVRLCRKISLLVRSYSGPALIGSSMQEQCRAVQYEMFCLKDESSLGGQNMREQRL